MKKSIKKILWYEMLKKFESLGYYYTADSSFLPKGYKRRQNLYRFDFTYKKDCKKLSIKEIKDFFKDEITVFAARSEYAPEQIHIYATNKIFLEDVKK